MLIVCLSIRLWKESIFFSIVSVIVHSSELYRNTDVESSDFHLYTHCPRFVDVIHLSHTTDCQSFPSVYILFCFNFGAKQLAVSSVRCFVGNRWFVVCCPVQFRPVACPLCVESVFSLWALVVVVVEEEVLEFGIFLFLFHWL